MSTPTPPEPEPGQMTADPGTTPEPGAATALTHRQIVVIISGLMMGMLLAALDLTIVSTSIRTISDDLDGLSIQAWVTTAYLITSTISTPLYGKLSDLYGRRPFFLTAISLFVVGSAMCGFAQDMYQLAAFRAFQGLGAGGLFSLALAIVGDIVSPRERARYQGYFLAVFGSSSVLGPLVGGFFAGADTILWVSGWRWVFLINVPIGIVALTVVARVLHIPHTRREHRIDLAGALALAVMLVPLLMVAEQGREWGWGSGGSIACYVIGVVGFLAFVTAERRIGDDALLPLRLFGNRTFSIGSTLNLIIGMGMFGGLAALPLYLQIVKEHSPTESGLLMLPLTAGMMTGSIVSGQFISKTGRYKVFPIAGSVLFTLGMFLYATMKVDTPIVVVGCFALIFGLGLGFNMQTLVLAMQNSVPPRDMGVATSSATFFRQMGGTLGTAVFLSVLFGSVAGNISDRIGEAAADPGSAFSQALKNPSVTSDPANAPIVNLVTKHDAGGLSIDDSSFITQLDPALARPVLEGFADSMHLVFLIGASVLVLAFLLSWFLPEEKLRTQSGLQARAAAE
ncbi:MFS transporter [Kineosporia sp. J2-2]|uniref:MFS transporter n=1 Tax=Kineosporia corallincola TaxID=2835133 RepID=A0ABS5TJR7_9ACTN|nr:MDR family MFS transporter [Kineosporia corallincola]MBT0771337.1 MFS transporter [Kineosporia corallincola]